MRKHIVAIAFIIFSLSHCKPRAEDASTAELKDVTLISDPIDLKMSEFGFDIEQGMPEDAQRGLRTVFAGLGFRMLVEETLFQKLIQFEPQRQWVVYGNPPSPASRMKLGPEAQKSGVFARDARGLTNKGRDVGTSFAVYTENGKRYMNFTCLQCHAGVVAGIQVAGLGNNHIDQFALSENLAQYRQYRDLYKKTSTLKQNLINTITGLNDADIEHLKAFTLYSETVLRPAIKGASSRGDDFGPFPVWQLMARLKNPGKSGFDLLGLDEGSSTLEQLIAATPLGPVDRRPWWLRKHDTKSYVYGDTLSEPLAGKDFAINFTVPHTGHNESYHDRSKLTADILAFAKWTKSPPYPYDTKGGASAPTFDPRASDANIEAGKKVYNTNCASCHGQVVAGQAKKWRLKYKSLPYAGKHDYWKNTCLSDVLYSTDKDKAGNAVSPLWTADTDLTYSCALMRFNSIANAAAPIRNFFAQQQFKIPSEWLPAVYNPEKPGYRAPPLVGIWASAPYLHNGSIPTLGDLFRHKDLKANGGSPRPIGWSRVIEVSKDFSYDIGMVGMQVVPYFTKQEFPKDPKRPYDHVLQTEYRRFFDTTVIGKSNKGAESCGASLSDNDKNLMLGFLKEFTDNNVEPDDQNCAFKPKRREKDYDGTSYNVKDHAVCADFYKSVGQKVY